MMEFGTLKMILRSTVMGLGVAFVPKSEVKQMKKMGLSNLKSFQNNTVR